MFSSLTETFMAPAGSKDAASAGKAASGKTTTTTGTRPSPLRSNKSASKTDTKTSKSASSSRQPSIVLDGTPADEVASTDKKSQQDKDKDAPSAFDTFGDAAGSDDNTPEPPRASVDMDELPIELIGLADRCVHDGPLQFVPNTNRY